MDRILAVLVLIGLMTPPSASLAQAAGAGSNVLTVADIGELLDRNVSEAEILVRVRAASCVHSRLATPSRQLASRGASLALVRAVEQKPCTDSEEPSGVDCTVGCVEVARDLMRQTSGTSDPTELGTQRSSSLTARDVRIFAILRPRCVMGTEESCLLFAVHALRVAGDSATRRARGADILPRFRDACSFGWYYACTLAGLMYVRGEAAPSQPDESASTLFKRACDRGELSGCWHLAEAIRTGSAQTPTDPIAAAELYDENCRRGEGRSCQFLGMAALGSGLLPLAPDSTAARQLLDRACTLGRSRACSYAGWLFMQGRGGDRDVRNASRTLSAACEGGEALACSNLGVLLARTQPAAADRGQVLDLYIRACTLGDDRGCVNLSNVVSLQAGQGEAEERASTAYESACDRGSAKGCWYLSQVPSASPSTPQRARRVRSIVEKACALGEKLACSSLTSKRRKLP